MSDKKKNNDNVIENEFIKYVRRTGGVACPMESEKMDSLPDWMILYPPERCVCVIFTKIDEDMPQIRRKRAFQLQKAGYPIIRIDHLTQIIPASQAIRQWKPGSMFPEDIGTKIPAAPENAGTDSEEDLLLLKEMLAIRKKADALMLQKRQEDAARRTREVQEAVNSDCEFYDMKGGHRVCRISMDISFCSKDCAFATNSPCSTDPYGTKYMNGRL